MPGATARDQPTHISPEACTLGEQPNSSHHRARSGAEQAIRKEITSSTLGESHITGASTHQEAEQKRASTRTRSVATELGRSRERTCDVWNRTHMGKPPPQGMSSSSASFFICVKRRRLRSKLHLILVVLTLEQTFYLKPIYMPSGPVAHLRCLSSSPNYLPQERSPTAKATTTTTHALNVASKKSAA